MLEQWPVLPCWNELIIIWPAVNHMAYRRPQTFISSGVTVEQLNAVQEVLVLWLYINLNPGQTHPYITDEVKMK